MLPANPFLQLTYPRLKSALPRVHNLIWNEVIPLKIAFGGNERDPVSVEKARQRSFKPVELPFTWGKLFDQGWFKISLPRDLPKQTTPLYLHWQEQGEATLYVDGVPHYGFDVAHRYCTLPIKAKELLVESLCLQSAIWHPAATGLDPAGSVVSKVALFTRNEQAWKAYHDLIVLTDLLEEEMKANFPLNKPSAVGIGFHPAVENVSPDYRQLLRRLDDAVNALDAGGIPALQSVLDAAFRDLRGRALPLSASLTGHAHIDLVWLWPERAGEAKAVHTFSTMNRLMDLYPEFRFAYSQPASYEAVERRSPKLMRAVQKRIAEKKWEPVGATEVESDTLIACGEALARSFLVGQERFRRLQGKPSRVLWIPDVFGYSGCLPQLMRQTGVDYFFTTKLTWCNLNKFPYSSFLWRGFDGSEVIVHVTQDNGYNQSVSAHEIKTGALAHRQSDVHREFLAPTGFGDGGGGPTEEMCERARRMADLAALPKVAWSRIDDFFERMDPIRSELPAFQGELYLEYHRGILTTHGGLKARFRAAERALQTWEAVRSVTSGRPLDEPVWRRLIFAQFHDYIPGSSIREVYEEGFAELEGIAENGLASSRNELSGGSAKSRRPALFNPLPLPQAVLLSGKKGQPARPVMLPPLTGRAVDKLDALPVFAPVTASATQLQTERVQVTFDTKGLIRQLVIDGQPIAQQGPLGGLMLYPDQAHMFDAWELDRQTLSLGRAPKAAAKLVSHHAAEFEAETVFEQQLSEKSSVRIRYSVDVCHPVLRIEYDFDWNDGGFLIKALFPTAYSGRSARYGAPFGSVLRSQQPGLPRDEAQFEVPGSRYAVVCDDGEQEGLAIITEAKYGFSCRDGTLGLSLLKSAYITGEDASHRRLFPKGLRRPGWTAVHSDIGPQKVRLAVARHQGSAPRTESAAALADLLFTPPMAYQGNDVSSGFEGLEGGDTLLPTWAKPEGKGVWTLRLNETSGRRGEARLQLAPGWTATQVDLSGTPLAGPKSVRTIKFKPYDLISLRISSAG